MSREIKFRAWNEEEKVMIDGDSLAFEEYAPIKDLLSQDGIMQFTGLYDDASNIVDADEDAEVYEDDIIEFTHENQNYIGQVVFEAGAFLAVGNGIPDGYISLIEISENDGRFCWITGKVIGNIHENPELMGEPT